MAKCGLCPVSFGLALGVFWGLSIFIMGLLAMHYAYGVNFVTSVGTMYLGYGPTLMGSLKGAGFGFVDGFISGAILAFLYNLFGGCRACNKSCGKDKE